MISRRRFGIGILALIGLSCCLPVVGVWIKYILPISTFYEQEENAAPQFDKLNEAVLQELPPPEGVTEISRRNWGTANKSDHGELLGLVYRTGNVSNETILKYYANTLLPNSWQPGQVSNLYFRGSSCVLVLLSADNTTYDVRIWHDFFSQAFSPQRLSPETMDFMIAFEMGHGSILKCPPP